MVWKFINVFCLFSLCHGHIFIKITLSFLGMVCSVLNFIQGKFLFWVIQNNSIIQQGTMCIVSLFVFNALTTDFSESPKNQNLIIFATRKL